MSVWVAAKSLYPPTSTFLPLVLTCLYHVHLTSSRLMFRREAEADVVTIRMHPTTGVCLAHLREQLEKYGERKLKIGAFAAASNVTGE